MQLFLPLLPIANNMIVGRVCDGFTVQYLGNIMMGRKSYNGTNILVKSRTICEMLINHDFIHQPMKIDIFLVNYIKISISISSPGVYQDFMKLG